MHVLNTNSKQPKIATALVTVVQYEVLLLAVTVELKIIIFVIVVLHEWS